MKPIRKIIGGLGNLMFKESFIYAQMREGVIPDLYVQSDKYWKKYAEEIKQRFSKDIGHDERVAIHVRRGDYLQTDFYVNLWETGYYQKALEHFKDEKFLIFCADRQNVEQDKLDREWCYWFFRGLLPNGNFTMHIPSPDEADDLNAMAACKGIIGANSSFSWWACYLGNGVKIMPKNWHSDGVERTVCPSDWIRI